uniref:Uncharacterized protein n=1 Tax=Onchocerca volvulus TaxID=6282 RepID=A0A8R1TR17_ONCVO
MIPNYRPVFHASHETLVALSKTFSPEGPPMPHRSCQVVTVLPSHSPYVKITNCSVQLPIYAFRSSL